MIVTDKYPIGLNRLIVLMVSLLITDLIQGYEEDSIMYACRTGCGLCKC